MSRNAPQLPNTNTTGNAVVVPTTTGFNAGDLVYYKGTTGDYVSPANLPVPSSISFPYTPNSSVFAASGGTSISSVFDTATGFYGGSRYKFAAVLTNGNIVQSWKNRSNNQAYFQVVDASGAIVVSPTSASSTYIASTQHNNVGVVALTGGGFVVYWVNASGGTANKPCYAVYSNTGSVVTSAVNDTSFSQTTAPSSAINGVALSGGGFALALGDSSDVSTYFRGFSATGVGAYAWTASITPNSFSLNAPALAARSDGSFVIFNLGSAAYNYVVVNSAGAIIISSTFAVTAGKNNPDATVLSDGMTIVFAYTNNASGNLTPCFRTLSAVNVLSAENTVPNSNMNVFGSYAPNFNSVFGLSTGNFIFMFCDCMQQMQYVVYNSAGVVQSGTNLAGALPITIRGPYVFSGTKPTMIEVGANITFYWQGSPSGKSSWYMYKASINKTTFQPVLSLSTAQQVTSYSVPTGAPILGSATATSLQYYAGATGSSVLSTAMGYLRTPTVIATSGCCTMTSTNLTDGRIAIAYLVFSTATLYVAIYSQTGVFQQTITVGPAYVLAAIDTSGTRGLIKMTGLLNGGFAIAYFTAAATISLSTYSSAGSLVTAGTATTVAENISTGRTIGLSTLSDGNLVFTFRNTSSAVRVAVFDVTTLAQIWIATIGGVTQYVNVVANKSGGFAHYGWNGTNYTFSSYYKQNSTTYTATGNTTVTTAVASGTTSQCLTYLPGSGYYFTDFISSNVSNIRAYDGGDPDIIGQYFDGPSVSGAINNSALGTTGNGSLVFFVAGSLYGFSSGLSASATTLPVFTYPSTNKFTLTGYTSVTDNCTSIAAGYGDYAVVAWLNSSNYPTFAFMEAMPNVAIASYTSGVTVSEFVDVVPYTSASASDVTNTVLSGVAMTTATAGGTGLVQTNGLAQLNSNYPSGTVQNFDFQSPNGTAVSGVKGSISGRNVLLQGTN
jgi:hypothetical protein